MTTIGFIGLGLMGEAMSKNIVAKHDGDVLVFDYNQAQVAKLVEAGATAVESSAEIAKKADVIISMVPKSEHVQAVYADLLPHLRDGQITIDMSTIDPSVSEDLSVQVAATGAVMLDAPVVKSVPAAVAAELGIYVGGDKEAYGKIEHILAMMGSNQIHLGANGRGLVMKILHNNLVGGIQNAVNEMVTAGVHYGIDKEDFGLAASYGGASNFYMSGKLPAIAKEDYTTAFSLENMAKDVNIMNAMMAESGLKLPGADVVKAVYDKGLEQGIGGEDFCATYKVVNSNAKI
ncbi:NAD(P)-dependent oxidoreductase [Ferrimonas lipolytica]|uniref:NAD(P)-dependent oxidoreductase n=1 Tax=Ferrimonas lipolytica TaxID=2724191 RepID=A0A6H1UFT7_9GAMM|nr:NAD(P)-dependent oxidoreductase [Ferrimonas lipolytica]QIZ77489.1 NAD(P)-dependent oxidoreductase [Ferrimonas lipolytica]